MFKKLVISACIIVYIPINSSDLSIPAPSTGQSITEQQPIKYNDEQEYGLVPALKHIGRYSLGGLAIRSGSEYLSHIAHEYGHALAHRFCGAVIVGVRVDLTWPFGAGEGVCNYAYPNYVSYYHLRRIFGAAAGPLAGIMSYAAMLKTIDLYSEYKKTGSLMTAFSNSWEKSIFNKDQNVGAMAIFAYLMSMQYNGSVIPIAGLNNDASRIIKHLGLISPILASVYSYMAPVGSYAFGAYLISKVARAWWDQLSKSTQENWIRFYND